MFLVLLRVLLVAGSIAAVLYFLYKWINKELITEEQQSKVEDAMISIKETIKVSENIPEIDTERLQKAHDHLDEIVKNLPKKMTFRNGVTLYLKLFKFIMFIFPVRTSMSVKAF